MKERVKKDKIPSRSRKSKATIKVSSACRTLVSCYLHQTFSSFDRGHPCTSASVDHLRGHDGRTEMEANRRRRRDQGGSSVRQVGNQHLMQPFPVTEPFLIKL